MHFLDFLISYHILSELNTLNFNTEQKSLSSG
jgi:hypothetical protein